MRKGIASWLVCLAVFVLLLSAFLLAGCSAGKLTEEKARKTAEVLLSKGTALPQIDKYVKLIEWQCLAQVSESEMHGKARIEGDGYKLSGAFVFHRNTEGKWVIDKVKFHSDHGSAWWNVDVFQKVE